MNFFYFESKFKIDFFFGRSGGGGGRARASYFFFTENPFFFGGGGRGVEDGGWGVGGRTDEQAQAFKCDLGLRPR